MQKPGCCPSMTLGMPLLSCEGAKSLLLIRHTMLNRCMNERLKLKRCLCRQQRKVFIRDSIVEKCSVSFGQKHTIEDSLLKQDSAPSSGNLDLASAPKRLEPYAQKFMGD